MKIVLITDAWQPQVNGVVTTLVELVRELGAAGHEVHGIHPGQFRTRPCPGYAGIDLAVRPGRQMAQQLDALQPEALHIATETVANTLLRQAVKMPLRTDRPAHRTRSF